MRLLSQSKEEMEIDGAQRIGDEKQQNRRSPQKLWHVVLENRYNGRGTRTLVRFIWGYCLWDKRKARDDSDQEMTDCLLFDRPGQED